MHLLFPQAVAVACAMSYAGSNVAARYGMRHSNPVTMTLVSFTTQTIVLGAYVAFSGNIPPLSYFPAILFIAIGFVMPIIRMLTYIGVSTLGASRSMALRSSHPLFGALFAVLVVRENPAPIVVAGTLLVVLGTFFISWQPQAENSQGWWYALFPLTAAAITGFIQPLVRFGLNSSAYPIFFTGVIGATALMLSVALLPLIRCYQRPVWSLRAAKGLIVASLLENLGFVLFITAFGLAPVATVSPLIATSPMWVVLAALLIFRKLEAVTWRTIAGAGLTVGGTIAITLG
jgi:drug/metabolite transporter (DMT)-like permease